jgi:hypothetical protein
MLGAGTVINPIIKIVTTIAILAAVYFFIVKPTLDTTNTAFDSFSDSFDGISGDVQSQLEDAFDSTDSSQQLENCIDRAIGNSGANEDRISRCIDRFGG